jgi:hypothetical protein
MQFNRYRKHAYIIMLNFVRMMLAIIIKLWLIFSRELKLADD